MTAALFRPLVQSTTAEYCESDLTDSLKKRTLVLKEAQELRVKAFIVELLVHRGLKIAQNIEKSFSVCSQEVSL